MSFSHDAHYNSGDSDWIEFGLGLLVGVLSIIIASIFRILSSLVLRVDAERTLLSKRSDSSMDSHVILGSYPIFTYLGAPHTLRTRSVLGFLTLLAVIIGTTALSISALAFSGSRVLRHGEPTVKLTARQGSSSSSSTLNDEDTIEKYSDWFRSTGVVSLCQRRISSKRIYFQPYVEQSSSTRVYCGKRLNDINIGHEISESIEDVQPSSLRITRLSRIDTSTPHSNYVIHEINIAGRGYNAVCNTGEYYRGVRSGRISQSCAFSTADTFILGGYTLSNTNSNLSGPGIIPSINDDIKYFDSYAVHIDTELQEQQLMLALTLWDLGSISEVEVAVLCRLSIIEETDIPGFIGGFQRLQIDTTLLSFGIGTAFIIIIIFIMILLWDGFSKPKEERLKNDITDPDFQSQLWRTEVHHQDNTTKITTNNQKNMLAIRDVTSCSCTQSQQQHDENCIVERTYRIGSSTVGRPIPQGINVGDIISQITGNR